MRGVVSFVFLLSSACAANAQDADPPSAGAIIRQSDQTLTCEQIVAAGAEISQALGETREQSMFGRFGGVVKAGASMLVPGAGLAIAGVEAMGEDERQAALAEDLARMNRWYYLNGLYFGKGCGTPALAGE
ncbi:hypothetical protein [Brevundimonas sp.]|jgi:hypothetical protein|uniref:hypothetical protein n=1 Tax=Brevundimonas sp. TaxID=1871086 RepID=UPI002E105ADC|nr:hypothetical protein [Brevundimonas sp.]